MSTAAIGQVITVFVLVGVLAALFVLPTNRETQAGQPRRSFLGDLIVGKDNRTSTSQCVALAWTFAIVYLILAALVTMWIGDGAGWKAFQGQNIGPYLVFLGGPYAAGVLATASAVKATQKGTKTKATTPATASQLVTDDAGQTDLGDFQYVLFNAIAIAFVVVSFAGHLNSGLPTIPQVLWALALTSAGGYTAKKLITDPLPVVPVSRTESNTVLSRTIATPAGAVRRPAARHTTVRGRPPD